MGKKLLLLVLLLTSACGRDFNDKLIFPKDEQTVAHGKNLVLGLAACGVCHGQSADPLSPLSGGRPSYDAYGELLSPNITPSSSGIGALSDDKILGALRGRWGEEAKHRSPDVHLGYEWMSDKDAMSIVSYIRTTPPISNEVPRRPLSFFARNTTGFFESQISVVGFVPDIPKKNKAQYGKYLVNNVARCGTCHSTPATLLIGQVYLGGGEVKNEKGSKNAPELIGGQGVMSSWSEPEIVNFFKSGKRPDGSFVDPDFCPIPYYRSASLDDVAAIATYIRSLS